VVSLTTETRLAHGAACGLLLSKSPLTAIEVKKAITIIEPNSMLGRRMLA
jgi:hypothetical protein